MITGILGKKIGMTQVFSKDGQMVPVTVIQAGPCTVTQIKTEDSDGYVAVQVGFQEKKRGNRPAQGHLDNSGPFRYLRELPTDGQEDVEVGQVVKVGIFGSGDRVDVTGLSKGRGFQGVVKRHGFHGGPRTHGQSDRHRAPGSVGGGTTPGRVYKGKGMAGHMGNERVTMRKLEVVQIDEERNILLIKGAVPGGHNGLLMIRKSRQGQKEA